MVRVVGKEEALGAGGIYIISEVSGVTPILRVTPRVASEQGEGRSTTLKRIAIPKISRWPLGNSLSVLKYVCSITHVHRFRSSLTPLMLRGVVGKRGITEKVHRRIFGKYSTCALAKKQTSLG